MVGYITSANNVRTQKEVLTGPDRTRHNVCTRKEVLAGPGRTRPKKPKVVPKTDPPNPHKTRITLECNRGM